MISEGGKIDIANAREAEKKLNELKEKTDNDKLRKSIEQKQRYVNKPIKK